MQIEYLSPDHALITGPGIAADAYCLELGPANLIFAKSSAGFVGCGFFDLAVFEKLGIPAAKVTGISTIEDLLKSPVSAATPAAVLRGAKTGVTGEEAIRRLCIFDR
ncbi:MAG: DUF1805 domain-containing protein [Methanocorpusculum sp.]|uniref:DUF1805 domain-containing protein n=1 Tax=Methanocorpusculum petauri TaxID=3002863 RepID=A0ABT4IHU3_9EURY|nr:DUF1805 domain-containing protein [Methanocorpusculum petauri]MCZ9312337.1 DUF1805 domain-containing protein [Methanocorpusculum sp.]MCZ0861320.1 DUF1805 domain-containing protein [Methanocorpusculum petauri]MDE2443199.1 DUF1805 domain-containing protein [Methanocorpusculum sp.]MDE2518349.1 DUF1805 domain-containing protein [Methanocorpusculum sp.]MDE2522305.1 DUF1805 domain-containing protein [Methanocorpusculum sp.]